jgi:hypothetical protein
VGWEASPAQHQRVARGADVLAQLADLGQEGAGVDRAGGRVAPRRAHDELVERGGDALDQPARRRHVLVTCR